MAPRAKRTIEELANKSDSDDDDYSDHPVRSARQAISRSKSKALKANDKKKNGRSKPPSRKRRRHDQSSEEDDDEDDDGVVSSEYDLLSESEDSSEDEEDIHAERNARGTVKRKAAKNKPVYNEDDGSSGLIEEEEEEEEEQIEEEDTRVKDDDDDDDDELVSSPAKKPSIVVRLKLPSRLQRQLSTDGPTTGRSTRRTRSVSEDQSSAPNDSQEGKEIDEIAQASFEDAGNLVVPESEKGAHVVVVDDDDHGITTRGRSGRSNPRQTPDVAADPEDNNTATTTPTNPRRSSRKMPSRKSSRQRKGGGDDDDEESDFNPEEEINDDDDDDDDDEDGEGASQSDKSAESQQKDSQAQNDEDDDHSSRRPGLRKRKPRSLAAQSESANDLAGELAEELEDLRADRPTRRRQQPQLIYEKPRRSRKDVDYRIIRPDLLFPIEEAENEVVATESPSRRGRGAGGAGGAWQRSLFPTYGPFGGGGPSAVLAPPGGTAAAATGGVESDSSDDEAIPQANPAGYGSVGASFAPPVQALATETNQGITGTPTNLGKIKDKQALADADPLGVDPNVNFDGVGGLQGHIDQLKEMVSLPLLYPEIFHRFHIVPPRGVLFHGPPGTGKTLLARALANSVSSEGRKVTFYMRKGADALSKWVGEAERQLRLLFEEARKTQPSIIFFDEIDGLAPVRSSKQEQIHSSIVSTLLALMDGMDGRGQVVVIGATNRPDTVDPALRRPGRFDREFYFPLPNIEGRRAILDIHTRGWDPPLPGVVKDELADITKGYGGADLRALCTEAALNAVQRRYPQIYKSDKKLLIDPRQIDVKPKDFMIAIKRIVPSSERSTSSGASPLPKTVEPLLRRPLLEIERLLAEIIPQGKKITALEEAQFEEPGGTSTNFNRERLQQEFETSRIFRPRLLVRGREGMGQQYLAGALLHHFEGLHVQAFDLATLLSDSTRSPEAAVVQLFSEVRRHKPSVIYIPNIQSWYETVGSSVVSTFLGLLRSIPPTDPVLLLGVLEENGGEEINPGLLKNLFGFSRKNIYDLTIPDRDTRHAFFQKVIGYIETKPTDFPDPEGRKKRRLEQLEVAPAPAEKPRPVPTKEQLRAQRKKDHLALNYLKVRIQPIMDQIKKYKRFRTGVIDESQIRYLWEEEEVAENSNAAASAAAADASISNNDLSIVEQRTTFRPFEKAYDKHGVLGLREVVSDKFYYNMEIVTIEKRLSNGYYKRPKDFLVDIKRIAKDAKQLGDQERLLRANELLSNVEVDIAGIEQAEPQLVAECEAIYVRELERGKIAVERAKSRVEQQIAAHGKDIPSQLTGTPDRRFSTGASAAPTHRSKVVAMTNGHGGDADGDTYMANSQDLSAMVLGSQPNADSNEASTTQTKSGGDSKLSSEQSTTVPNGLLHQQRQKSPVPLFDAAPHPSSSGQPSQLPNHNNDDNNASPELVIDGQRIADLHKNLADRTSGCSVEQLEQVNTSLVDYIWSKRGEWDRNKVAAGVGDVFNDVLEDIYSVQEIVSPLTMSENTRTPTR